MSSVMLVLAIAGGVAGLQAAIWIPFIMIWSKKRAEFDARFERERAESGEKILRGPEKGVYNGSTQNYGSVKGNGRMWLTDKRIVFCKMTGGVVEIPLANVRGTREAKVFLRSISAGYMHFIVDTADRAEVGFYVSDNAAWARDLASIAKSG
ncbi:MAG: hypothetical protein ACREJX_16940 [Polyangiaceae bacterium]